MLRIVQNSSATGARSYYSTADYYTEGQELEGNWRGKGAARLGLAGKIEQPAWDALCDNRDPSTGLPLTVRRKQERSVGYDFNFHVSKSVSLIYGLTRDERILDAFRASVDETMRYMESEMQTRVRAGGKNEDRKTGNMLYGEFIHFTSRPVGGVPDPHLHAHCFVHNVTFDEAENRFKAGQFRDLKRDAPYFEAVFHSHMGRRMAELGLPVERTKKGWEIQGLSRATLDKFSRRTALIEERAKEEGIIDAEKKSELGAKTRERKRKNLSMDELREEWRSRLSTDEQSGTAAIGERVGGRPIAENVRAAQEAAILAVDHCFERKSVVPERTLLAEALKRCVGHANVRTVENAVRQQNIIVGEKDGRQFATTADVLAEEKRMLDFAREGRGTSRPLGNGSHAFKRDWLNDGQRNAVNHVLNSADRVILIRGAAGTGKTSMMQEAVGAIEAKGTKVFTFAPSADASRGVLRAEGFKNADTVALLLTDEKLQQQVRGQVMWIDEASLMGGRTTAQVFDLAAKLDARVILSGDVRQHASIERGAALRLLETEAGLVPAEIRNIQRQKGAYKSAVQALSEGNVESGFHQLDRLGWVKEVNELDRYKILARDYVATVAEGKSALVVSPTHIEGEWVTDEIRSELKRTAKPGRKPGQYMLGAEQRQFLSLENAHLTPAERRDSVNYLPGADVLVFHQNAKGFRKGDRLVAGEGPLPLEHADKFSVFHAGTMPIAPGELIRVARNGNTADGAHRLNNGAIFTVKNFTTKGDIRLTNGWTIAKDFGHLTHGYVVTSHASQGKTVDRVLIGQSAQSFPASSREQFYVSVSRGRQQATIYTDDKKSLLDAVSHSDDRMTATEFVAGKEHYERTVAVQRMQRQLDPVRENGRDGRDREGMSHER